MSLQTLDRAVAALHAIGKAGRDGLRFSDLQRNLGLSKPTAHRLLNALLSHGLVQHELPQRRYRLGPGLQSLARAAASPVLDLPRLCAPAVSYLAEESGDTVFLNARDGLYTVCLSRETGSYPIRAVTVEVGTRRPLGIGAGGLSILGALSAEEADRIVEALAPKYEGFPLNSPEQIARSHRQARRSGYGLSDERVAKGVRAVAVAIRDDAGAPVATLGLAAIRQRVSTERIPILVAMLKRERTVIEQRIAELVRQTSA